MKLFALSNRVKDRIKVICHIRLFVFVITNDLLLFSIRCGNISMFLFVFQIAKCVFVFLLQIKIIIDQIKWPVIQFQSDLKLLIWPTIIRDRKKTMIVVAIDLNVYIYKMWASLTCFLFKFNQYQSAISSQLFAIYQIEFFGFQLVLFLPIFVDSSIYFLAK